MSISITKIKSDVRKSWIGERYYIEKPEFWVKMADVRERDTEEKKHRCVGHVDSHPNLFLENFTGKGTLYYWYKNKIKGKKKTNTFVAFLFKQNSTSRANVFPRWFLDLVHIEKVYWKGIVKNNNAGHIQRTAQFPTENGRIHGVCVFAEESKRTIGSCRQNEGGSGHWFVSMLIFYFNFLFPLSHAVFHLFYFVQLFFIFYFSSKFSFPLNEAYIFHFLIYVKNAVSLRHWES